MFPLYPRQDHEETSNPELPTQQAQTKQNKTNHIQEKPDTLAKDQGKDGITENVFGNTSTTPNTNDLPVPIGRSRQCFKYPVGGLMGLNRELSFYHHAEKQAVI